MTNHAKTAVPKIKKLRGLIAAPHTPFAPNGDVALGPIRRQADLLVKHGVVGAYVCGTTGEGVSCTVVERQAVLEEWVARSRGRLFLIAHVGALSIRDAQALAGHAQAAGADATSVVPASFFKPGSVAGLVDYLGPIAACAPRLPFYYYHTTMSGVALPMVPFLEAAGAKIPNLAGIKWNNPDLYEYQNCLRACGGRYDIVWGVDEFLAGAVALGARAAIGSTYNYAAPLYRKIWKSVEAGRLQEARAGMAKVCRIVDILVQYGGVAAGKAMMAIHGIDAGDPRPPIRPLSAAEKSDVVARLRAIIAGDVTFRE
jgi:N-acetylneuraminate lyase